ncbi:dirigent protein 20 [Eucalyptus grandis]|uniref:dirigent protein 20 n=1 Tax=Eucalyptus grandis TaxID=71139 RepID=UPI000525DBF3|nr:dirigent protein 20 [Eucalyptus grandis]
MSRLVFALSLLLSCLAVAAAGKSSGYSEILEVNPQNTMPWKEKLTHVHFFWHDILAGPNLSAVAVVPPQANSPTFFGSVSVINDALTIGPALSSGIIGRA